MAAVRPLDPEDHDAVVALSLRAWEPVFRSMEQVLGPSGVFAQLYPDWRAAQATAVREAITTPGGHTWVAALDERRVVAGFAAVVLHADETVGEVRMIAVDPPAQRRGLAAALLTVATGWIQAQGRTVAMIGTGADAGHAPARAVYEHAGFTGMPAVNYFKKL